MKNIFTKIFIISALLSFLFSCTPTGGTVILEYDMKSTYLYTNTSEHDVEIHAWGINWAGDREYFEHTWNLKSLDSLEFRYRLTLSAYEGPDVSLIHADSVKIVFPDKKEVWYRRCDGQENNIMTPLPDQIRRKYIYNISQEHYENRK